MTGLIGNLDPWVQAVFLKFKVSDKKRTNQMKFCLAGITVLIL